MNGLALYDMKKRKHKNRKRNSRVTTNTRNAGGRAHNVLRTD